MATDNNLTTISVLASADLSALQYRFMTINSSGLLAATGAGAMADGVLQDKPAAASRPGQLAIAGVSKVTAGAAITAGDYVMATTNGKAITAVSAGTNQTLGRALAAAAADGDIIPVLLKVQTGKATT